MKLEFFGGLFRVWVKKKMIFFGSSQDFNWRSQNNIIGIWSVNYLKSDPITEIRRINFNAVDFRYNII